jgi:hypothetical protein
MTPPPRNRVRGYRHSGTRPTGSALATTAAARHPTGRSGNINTNNNRRQVGPLQAIAPGPVRAIVFIQPKRDGPVEGKLVNYRSRKRVDARGCVEFLILARRVASCPGELRLRDRPNVSTKDFEVEKPLVHRTVVLPEIECCFRLGRSSRPVLIASVDEQHEMTGR